ncbi:MAG: 4Fe-4S dicluster domain-containing protein [Candidatus Riflebacteria bacterium]|nr:4Fe-4S dicluster domain-containing protein [Candidatus Riflebacteria bacterium]
MSNVLIVAPDRCIDCKKCELACSLHHAGSLDPDRGRIKVLNRGVEKGMPVVCLHCDEAACLIVCPVGAISRCDETDAVVLDETRCVRCKACLAACPFGNITEDRVDGRVLKCDLCEGAPMCAVFCPSGALVTRSGPRPLRSAP